MKKFLLTLIVTMLAFVGTWADDDVVLNFGTGSTWTFVGSGSDNITGVAINVAKEGDLATIKSQMVFKGTEADDRLTVYNLDYVKSKSVTITGTLSEADMQVLAETGNPIWYAFLNASALNLSGAEYGDDVVTKELTMNAGGTFTKPTSAGGEEPGGEEPGDSYTVTFVDNVITFTSSKAGDFHTWYETVNWNEENGNPGRNQFANYDVIISGPLSSTDIEDLNTRYPKTLDLADATGYISSDISHQYNLLVLPKDMAAPTADVLSAKANSSQMVVIIPSSDNSTLKVYSSMEGSVIAVSSNKYIANHSTYGDVELIDGSNVNDADKTALGLPTGGGSGSGGGESGDPEPGPAPAVVTTGHVTYTTTLATNDVATINLAACGGDCTHTTLAGILSDASISTDDAFAKVIISGAATSDFVEQVANLNTKALVLADVTDLTVSPTLSNSYVKNLVLPNGLHKDVVTAENLAGFTSLESAASVESLSETKTTDHYYYTPNGGSKTEFTGVVVDKGEGVYEGTVTEHPTVQLDNEIVVNTYVNNYYKNEVTEIAEDATDASDVYIAGGVAKVNRQKVLLSGTKYYYSDEECTSKIDDWKIQTETEDGENQGKPYYWDNDVKNFGVYVKWEYKYQSQETWGDVIYDGEEPTQEGDKFVGYMTFSPAKEYALTTKYNYTYKFDPTDESEEAKPISFNESKTVAQVNRDVTYALEKETNDDIVDLGQSLVAYVKEAGHLAHTLQHVPAFNPVFTQYDYWYSPTAGYDYKTPNLKRITLAGTINAWDLNKKNNPHVTADGHYSSAEDQGNSTFDGLLISHLDLENAVFTDNNDMVLNGYGLFDMEARYEQFITLPNSPLMTKIPAHSLQNLRGVKTLCIPYHYTVIGAEALKASDISHIYTTSPRTQDVEGNHYEKDAPLDLGPTSWTLPPFLERIETGAFWTRVTGGVSDVYIYNPVPPLCEKDAFPKGMYTGWGGFAGNTAHPIRRENYKNNDFLFTILHFPAGLSDADRGKYTDITRQYSFMDETGATDDDGNIFMWPAMNQFYRAYDQAVAGVTWDAWVKSNDPNDYSGENGWDPFVTYDEFEAARTGTADHINPTYGTSYSDLATTVQYDYDKYMGWHQFVLVGSTNYQKKTGDEKYWNFSKFKKQDWYTLCVPFNMTKDDLARVFGAKAHDAVLYTQEEIDNAIEGDDAYGKTAGQVKIPAVLETVYPDVITLAGVTRNVSSSHIQIQLSDNLIGKKLLDNDGLIETTLNGSKHVPSYETRTGGDNEVIIEANKPYFIRPHLPAEEIAIANAGNRAVEYTPMPSTDTQKPYIKHRVNVLNADQTKYLDWQDKSSDAVPAQPYQYYFVGSYIKQTMPDYAYYLGTKGGASTVFRHKQNGGKTWGQYTTIIGGVASADSKVEIIGGEMNGKEVTNYQVKFTAEEDFTFSQALPSQTSAKSFSYGIVTDEGEATGIMLPNEDGSMTMIPTNSKVYNMNGQFVGTSLNNLSKGIYIVNGKKFIVK